MIETYWSRPRLLLTCSARLFAGLQILIEPLQRAIGEVDLVFGFLDTVSLAGIAENRYRFPKSAQRDKCLPGRVRKSAVGFAILDQHGRRHLVKLEIRRVLDVEIAVLPGANTLVVVFVQPQAISAAVVLEFAVRRKKVGIAR